jgi:hypothetical protein
MFQTKAASTCQHELTLGLVSGLWYSNHGFVSDFVPRIFQPKTLAKGITP